ncbi:hypothetical protein HN51_047214 [Arachis hypogaea]|uniref:DUF4378 domain-containing protein n=1 Tax=Arachis hypogaea TaxID=3818 RepID=A0A445AFT2_ARAHY|nr:uncharacterized protein LOC107625138 [Arachis ipaensis]XP_020971345.1 uncharacterized protein LOC107625138 [Arachis ipaensis]XP_025632654.1 uncharacterized protein LOC112727200 [Arachis hypogaea]XP_025632655.1 uncharacterized protein LOC112727200 [Arachis hypogaea]QHO23515.1 uncharacterized protein DS421_12g364220 [Arachis hypogaea]QHO23516.1 uncharacterized protein DS421_12g364220 [Arachis hypogaea]RYR25287.1 hypothetical protein Ahy_B02g058972 [Arachis hypogaea]
MLKAEENSNHKQPNVVAKLMGLDEALPRGEANLFLERKHEKCYSQHIYGHLRSPLKHWQVEDSVKDKEMVHDVLHSRTEQNAHNQDKMALIHQKFMEAKLMSRKSKKFEDGFKVLSSNNDALIRLLDSQNLYDLRRSASPAETELITLLRPAKTLDNNNRSSRMEKKKKNEGMEKNLEHNVPVQSTRIVVLKPSSGKTNDLKAMYSPKTSLPEDDFFESRKVKRELTCQCDETLFECSSNKSYYNYKDRRSFSDLDATMSQLPRHSWDHSLYSTRSLDRVTCSPESPVCIEAKSRLYERWIMMMTSSNTKFHHQEQIHVKRRSTLGELLSLSQRKKHVTPKVKDIIIEDQEPRKSRNEELMVNSAPKSRRIRLRDEVCDHDAGKGHGSKGMRLSFKGRVSSFLFLRKKKSTKEKSKDKSQCSSLYESDSVSNRKQQGIITLEHELIVSKPEISSENQDQPSPSSILEPLFQDDIHHDFYDSMKSGHQGSLVPLKSNLIDKSPPIESVSRTLSWGDTDAHDSSLDSKAEEQEWLLLVEKLLSAAGLDDQLQNDSFDTRWHSLESPLDPSLRGKYVNLNDREHQHLNEAKRRKMRSSQKLVFDCVNAAILELTNGECGPGKHHKCRVHSSGTCSLSMDHIVDQMKELMASGVRCVWGDCGDSNSLVVENVVKKELVGIGWVQLMELEIDILGMEIERDLIQELVENVVVDFTARASINPF